jgi:hypothetical protein
VQGFGFDCYGEREGCGVLLEGGEGAVERLGCCAFAVSVFAFVSCSYGDLVLVGVEGGWLVMRTCDA